MWLRPGIRPIEAGSGGEPPGFEGPIRGEERRSLTEKAPGSSAQNADGKVPGPALRRQAAAGIGKTG